MREMSICIKCECYNCKKSGSCLDCQSCFDNDYFVDVCKSECPDRKEEEE